MIIGILAGEASGDALGAGLMRALNAARPDLEFVGVGGEQMLAEGLEPVAPMELLAINGLIEPIKKLPQLAVLLKRLLRVFAERQPAAFIGVDFNVFNFLIERLLKKRGVPTAHYVSPSVYAWRRGRVRRIGRSTDLLLTLFPFEPPYYADTSVQAVFVGHPLADDIAPGDGSAEQRSRMRRGLAIPSDQNCIALLPGSRVAEIKLMLERFLAAAEVIELRREDTVFVIPCVSRDIERRVIDALAKHPHLQVLTYEGSARRALIACDAALVKSGTGTLEAMLLRRPMVVTYRLGEISYRIVRRMLTTRFVALPNILCDRELVPELLQHEATPDALAETLLAEMDKAERDPAYLAGFEDLHLSLRQNADARAAAAVLSWLGQAGKVVDDAVC